MGTETVEKAGRSRGGGSHLSDAERLIIIAALLDGNSRLEQVNIKLAEAGYAPIVYQTLNNIRKAPDVAAAMEERRQGILAELNGNNIDNLLRYADLAKKAKDKLTPNGELYVTPDNHKAMSALFRIFDTSAQRINDAVNPAKRGAGAILEAEKDAMGAIETNPGLSEEDQVSMSIALREGVNAILRAKLAQAQAARQAESSAEPEAQ